MITASPREPSFRETLAVRPTRLCIWGTSLKKIADEAQVIAFIQIVTRRFPGAKITLFSQFGALMTELLKSKNLSVTTIRTANLPRVVRAIARTDLLVLEGGPFYEDAIQMLRCWFLVACAKLFRRPVIAYGATAFHFTTWWGRWAYRRLFNRLDVISVRERVGHEIIQELGVQPKVELFADPRLVLEPAPPESVHRILMAEGLDPDRPLIGITTRHLHAGMPQWVKRSHGYAEDLVTWANQVMARIIGYLAERAQLVLLPMHPALAEDQETAKALRTGLSDPDRLAVLSRRYTAIEILGIIKHCDPVLASRVGSAVFATVTATPLIAIAYEPRMKDHMDRVGLGDSVVEWTALDFDELAARIDRVWSSRHATRRELETRLAELQALAWGNARILDRYFSKAGLTPAT